ncbi:hypothetical protein GCM10008967_00820 [Bacillus carboniphilus]|uniref:Cell wall-active antibiotics response LiaF-like C-terminal domain-containing protein n=1 Tax=Bacillus carboniphilus TaxID=86663 RepID=A0ABN0VPN3_9BACI
MRALFPLLLLGTGVVLLLLNFGVISFGLEEIFVLVYPFILIFFGLRWLYKGFKNPSLFLLILGGFTTIFSTLLIADRLEIIDFAFSDGKKLWPLLFILIGIWMLGSKLRRKQKSSVKEPIQLASNEHDIDDEEFDTMGDEYDSIGDEFDKLDHDMDDLQADINNSVKDIQQQVDEKLKNIGKNIRIDISKSDDNKKKVKVEVNGKDVTELKEKKMRNIGVTSLSMKKPNWELTPLDLSSTIGNYYFDFSKAYIPDEEITIKIKCRVSDIKMIVPEGIPIKVNASVNIGDVKVMGNYWGGDCSFVSKNYDEATRKLNINIKAWVGDVRIEGV